MAGDGQAVYVNKLMQTERISGIETDNNEAEEEDDDEVEDPVQTLRRPNQQVFINTTHTYQMCDLRD